MANNYQTNGAYPSYQTPKPSMPPRTPPLLLEISGLALRVI
jgi:hypothetical protein